MTNRVPLTPSLPLEIGSLIVRDLPLEELTTERAIQGGVIHPEVYRDERLRRYRQERGWIQQAIVAIRSGYPQDVPLILPPGLIDEGLLDGILFETGRYGYKKLIEYLFQHGASNPTEIILGMATSTRDYPDLLERLLRFPLGLSDLQKILTASLKENAFQIAREVAIRYPGIEPSYTSFNAASLWWVLYHQNVGITFEPPSYEHNFTLLGGGFGMVLPVERLRRESLYEIAVSPAKFPYPYTWEEWGERDPPLIAVLNTCVRQLLNGESDDFDKIRRLWEIYLRTTVDRDMEWVIELGRLAWIEEVEFLEEVSMELANRGEIRLHLILLNEVPDVEVDDLVEFCLANDITPFDPKIMVLMRRRLGYLFKAGEWTPLWVPLVRNYLELNNDAILEIVEYYLGRDDQVIQNLWYGVERTTRVEILYEILRLKDLDSYNRYHSLVGELTIREIQVLRDSAIRAGLNSIVTSLSVLIPGVSPEVLADGFPRLAGGLRQRLSYAVPHTHEELEHEVVEADRQYEEFAPTFERELVRLGWS